MNRLIKARSNLPGVIRDSDDNIYANVNIFNDTPQFIPAKTNLSSTQYLVDRADDFYLSLLEFTLPESSIKILTFKEDFWSVTLEFNGNFYQRFLVFDPISGSNINPGEVYSYQQFIDMINVAFEGAYQDLVAVEGAVPPPEAPQVTFSAEGGLCNLFLPAQYDPYFVNPAYDPNVDPYPTISIYFNNNLFSLFSHSWTVRIIGFDRPDGDDVRFTISDWVTNRYLPDPPNQALNTGYYENKQQINTLSLWYDYYAILLISDDLPISNQYISLDETPILKTQKIIYSYNPIKEDPDKINKYKYVNDGEYRLIDLKGEKGINKISLRVAIIDKDGSLRQYFLPPNNSLNVKLGFFRKTMHNNYYLI